MRYGLSEQTIEKICGVFTNHPAVEKAVLYGSRAKGNFRPGSDIDLSLHGAGLSLKELGEIDSELDDLLLPYSVDLLVFDNLDHAKLRDHIERVGVIFYQRTSAVGEKDVANKAGWSLRPLAEVCQIKPPKAEARRLLTGTDMVSFVPMEDLVIDHKTFVPTQAKPLEEVSGSYTYFADGDVLLAKITPCFENGKLGIAANLTNGIGFGSSEYIVFRPDDSLDKEWLYYFLSRESFRTEGAARMSGAVGHKRVSKEFVESYPIPVPPLPEQKRIAGILDKAFDGIATAKANIEKNLQNARALFESHLKSVFTQRGEGWVEKKLGEVYDVRDGTHDSTKYHDTGYPLITSKNLKREGLSFDDIKLINEQDYNKINERSAVHKGDVLLAMIGTIGNPTLVEVEPNFAIKNVALFKIPSGQSGAFLKHYLSSGLVISKMMNEAKGSTQKFVGLGYLRDFPINLPPFATQLKVVENLDELSTEAQCLETIYQQKLAALDALKKSLLDKAFSGVL